MLRLSGENNTADKIPIKAFRNKMKQKAAVAKFVMVIVYDRDRIQMSLWYGKVINNIWQSPKGKTDRKPSMEAALRELESFQNLQTIQ